MWFFSSIDIKEALAAENGIEAVEEDSNKLSYAEPLAPEEIRWFYKDGVHKRWLEFCGYDSLRIENVWRQKEKYKNNEKNEDPPLPVERVVVRGGMYDVELDNMRCVSIYWPGMLISLKYKIFSIYKLHHIVTNHLCKIVYNI